MFNFESWLFYAYKAEQALVSRKLLLAVLSILKNFEFDSFYIAQTSRVVPKAIEKVIPQSLLKAAAPLSPTPGALHLANPISLPFGLPYV
jgi:hypothetical protein